MKDLRIKRLRIEVKKGKAIFDVIAEYDIEGFEHNMRDIAVQEGDTIYLKVSKKKL